MKSSIAMVKETFKDFSEDKVPRLSAAMAYYSVFSIGPLLVLMVGLAGLILGQERVRHEVAAQLQGVVGEKSARMVESMMTAKRSGDSLIATLVGGVALLLGAAGVFGQLQDALNTIWEVKPKPGMGIMTFLRQRFLSMTMVLGIGFLLLISMVLTTLVNAFAGYLGGMVSVPGWVAQLLNEMLSFGVITVLFALIFKVLPDVKVHWADVWVGAVITSLLFVVGKFGLGLYLGRESTTSAYGAGAAFILILLYIYYSSLIMFLGAEFTQVYAKRSGRKVEPTKYAVPITDEARAQEGTPRSGKQTPSQKPSSSRAQPSPVPAFATTAPEASTPGGTSGGVQPVSFRAPVEVIRAQPASLIGPAVVAGIAATLFFKFKIVRKAAGVYLFSRWG